MSIIGKGLLLGIAAMIQGFAMATFLFPHFIPTGGAASVAVLMNYVVKVPFETSLWVLNASLLFAAVKWLGKASALWTMYCVTVTSITINLLSPFTTEQVFNVFLDLPIGSVIFGIGIGILFRMGASSGGMDILALLISKTNGYPPGKTLFFINGTILLVTGVVVDWKIILFAIAGQFISTMILDLVCKGRLKPKMHKKKQSYYKPS
ncbi:YitT family protein [Fredinandcohnia humi]